MALDPNEPFGLPKGTVRGLIAVAFTAVTIFLYATNQVVPESLLAINGLVVGAYFGYRQGTAPDDGGTVNEGVDPPYIPDEK